MEFPNCIPYDRWINSQLSIARHYWWIKINWKNYIVDYIFAEETHDWLCKPDLVEQSFYEKRIKDNKEKVREYNLKLKQKNEEQKNEEQNKLPF